MTDAQKVAAESIEECKKVAAEAVYPIVERHAYMENLFNEIDRLAAANREGN